MVFVDTSAWFAAVVPRDPNHLSAADWLANNVTTPLITTDYIIDETLTLLMARGERTRALLLGTRFFRAEFVQIYKLTESHIMQAWEVFETFSDKEWSFTDCTSKVLIEELGIGHAFAFDRHFNQFGTVELVP